MSRRLVLAQADGDMGVTSCVDCLLPHGPEAECSFECPECTLPLEYNSRRSELKCRGCAYRREAGE